MRDLWLRLRALFLRKRVEHELHDELDFHIEMQVRKRIAEGMPEVEARRHAQIEFGAQTTVAEQCRDQRRINFFETLIQDIRYAMRGFRRTPLFAITVIATIALGLGINTAVFTIFNAYVLRPISVRDPGSLYELHWENHAGWFGLTADQYEQCRRDNPALTETFAARNLQLRVNGRVSYTELVSGNYFRMLSVNAFMGRTLLPSDAAAPGREPVTVLSYGAWQNMFASDPDIIGKKVLIHGYPLEIVGVAAQGFSGMNEMAEDFWAPLSMVAELDSVRDAGVRVFGRLRPDFTVEQANAALSVQAQLLTANEPANQRATSAVLRSRATSVPLSEMAIMVMSPIIVAFGLILLIACANVANMMLARAMARQREIGIRLSLGAARARLIRQLLTESILLALPAAAMGFLISRIIVDAGVRIMFATMPPEFSEYLRIVPMPPDFRVFAFMMTAALAAAVLFGLAPAFQATRASVIQAARGDFGNEYRPARLRNALVVVQIAGCVLLLIVTGVLLRGANRVHAVDHGIETAHVIVMEIQEKSRARVLATLPADPSVEAVAGASKVPLDSAFRRLTDFGCYVSVSPEFFQVFRIPLLRGRNFTANEALDRSRVAIITETLAHHMFPHADALGQSIRVPKSPDVRVIGIARDINPDITDGEVERSVLFLPISPAAPETALMVQVSGDTEAAKQRIDSMLDKAVPGAVDEIHKMDLFIIGRNYPFKVAYWISAAVGALALALAIVGIYGVISYIVVQRRKEIGIRVVMGASRKQVVGLVVRQSVRLAFIGLAIGTAIALGISRVYAHSFDKSGMMNAFDFLAYAGGIAVVFAACLVAGFIPSLRAARIDPVTTLRCD
jgi:predicted permease